MRMTLFMKMYRDHWKSLIAWGLVIVFMVTIQLSVYPTIVKSGKAAKQFIDSYPEAFKKMFRMQDYTSGAGYLGTELFSLMIPLVMIAVGITWGSSAIAEEEENRTADLLFALPIKRATILYSRVLATITALALLAAVTFLNVLALKGHFKLSVNNLKLFYACLAQFFLGIFFSSVGYFLGSSTGRKGLSLGIGSGLGIIAFLFFSLAPLVSNFEYTNPFNPFQWTIARNALTDGLDVVGVLKLAGTSLIFYILAIITLERREIRS